MDNNKDTLWDYICENLNLPTNLQSYETMSDIISAIKRAYFFGISERDDCRWLSQKIGRVTDFRDNCEQFNEK